MRIKAIEVLPDDGARLAEALRKQQHFTNGITDREMSLSYAELETKLGEIHQAGAIYSHVSQMSNPCKSNMCN